MSIMLFAAADEASGLPLGLSLESFVIQIITFLIVFFLIKRFAVGPIVRLLEKRRITIEDGVKMGIRMEHQREKVDKELAELKREARNEADRIIANAHKESRDVLRAAEKAAQRKTDAMLSDAEIRIKEEQDQARRSLESELAELVSEATEAVVGEKVDQKKDAEIIKKAMKGRK